MKINGVKLIIGSVVIANMTLQSISGYANELETNANPIFNMTYSYFETGNGLIQVLERTGDILDVVSPSYFDLTQDGNLKLTPYFDHSTIKEMQSKGFKVVPFLSNHWDRNVGRSALENKDKLIKELVTIINEYKLDGINVDIENITHEDRDNFTEFIKELRKSLPKDKEVSVAVPANPKGYTTGWYGAYDNKALTQYVDYIMIMTYDENYDGDPTPGPVASIQFVENSIIQLLGEVPPSKIVLGLPFFARAWKNDGSIKGRGMSLIKVNELINKYNGSVTFDAISKSPRAIVTITGYERNLSLGTYTVWFENEESILNKLQLINKYNLKGAGSWSLHQATQDIWDVYNQWSEGSRIFLDLEDSWAKAPILAVSNKGWMIGTRDYYFEPNKPLTRAQAATLLVRILGLENNNPNSPYFADVPNNHWAKKDINIVAQHNLMNGKGESVFAPDEYITREEMATLLSRLLKISPSYHSYNPFRDVDSNRWSYPFIISMAENRIFEGFEDKTFRPTENITRSQMAALLDRIKDMINK
ncbi:MAG: glycoside hydrolase [Tissierellia bacterium]|nr:glycoside hydrolase [Tissierellia bacterium]